MNRKDGQTINERIYGWINEVTNENALIHCLEKEQGRIHGNPCRGRLGRGSNELGRGSKELGRGSKELGRGSNELGRGTSNHKILISELFYLQTAQKRKKVKCDGRTDRPTKI